MGAHLEVHIGAVGQDWAIVLILLNQAPLANPVPTHPGAPRVMAASAQRGSA